jgi:hypothetical protein
MRWLIVGIGVALASCSSPATQAEKAYNTAHSKGSAAGRCAAARKVADVYQQAHDENKYRTWRGTASGECRMARMAKGSAG